ncbi:MAG TPA: single-stranded-DNA-specific exonuclease RecJ [Bacillota bacterium]|jgi:single-stranded-DNA-specific exonuclease|nr:single-stranded-DNA-specific exonuclease RecJ [Peptococcaceae bacterium MAG4]HPZ44136.1 single-stranded-DNA-specific exonuclease RecJ [Bacillota bacterium]HQD76912.1 single-stranded-DNA-specific exonuclease RecJ [Bacillota bacterium]HUM59382.1 single-stranded-DNA-specific exonuclease RecJ [Bacillota bacterium]
MKNIPKHKAKIWRVKASDPVLSQIFAHKLKISPITAQLLINRGIYTVEQGLAFLGSELESLHNPYLMKDLKKAVDRILKAARSGERILLYGDYDVDGITSTALLTRVLQGIGADVHSYLPHRLTEGYGLHLAPLQRAREEGTSLVVTLDCGINALEEALWAKNNGLDLIITDHHEPPPELPQAVAVVNPKRQDCLYPFKELAGVGVALKVAQAIIKESGKKNAAWQDYLDLVCLGTIADVVPLHGENRILVKHGLPRLAHTDKCGLRALIKVSGIEKNTLCARDVGFGLAPRLNAAGRLDSPGKALRLLLTDNPAEAWEIACELNRSNQERQKIETDVLNEAFHLLQAKPHLQEAKVLVLASEGWHPGVIGIVASRLTEMFNRPVLLVALEGEEGKGSARSIPGFNMYQALDHCREHLLNYGGHALAAGFTIDRVKIEGLAKEINHYAAEVFAHVETVPLLELDAIIDAAQIDEELVGEIESLSPFGNTNPQPLLCFRKAKILESRVVGKNANHLKFKLKVENKALEGIGFNLGAYAETVAAASEVDLAFVPALNSFNGRCSIVLEVKELGTPASLDVLNQDESLNFDSSFTDILKENSELQVDLFVPEFVLETLDNNIPFSDHDTIFSGLDTDKVKELFHNVVLTDWRGILDRPAQLAKLAECGEPTLVITSCAYQTIELARFLQLTNPALRGQTGCLNKAVSAEQRDRTASMFQSGQIKIVIATPNTAVPLISYAQEVLFYHLPYDDLACSSIIRAMQPGGRLYLLFGPEDFEENKTWLEVMAPDRNCLAIIYSYLRKANNNGFLELTDGADLVRAMSLAGFPKFHACTTKTALKIFQELSLIIKQDLAQTKRFKLLPAPSKKKDLGESITFRSLQSIKNKSLSWMKFILNDPLHP